MKSSIKRQTSSIQSRQRKGKNQDLQLKAGSNEVRNTVSAAARLHRPLMDGSQQIVAASTDSSRNVVTSTSNGICAPRESNLTPTDRNICLRCACMSPDLQAHLYCRDEKGSCVSQVLAQTFRRCSSDPPAVRMYGTTAD